MKIFRILLLAVLTLGISLAVMSQTPAPPDPAPIVEMIKALISQYFVSVLVVVPAVVFVAGLVNNVIKASGFGKQLIAWIVSVAFALIGFWLDLGIFAPLLNIGQAILLGVLIGFGANGIFDIPLIQQIIAALFPKAYTKLR